MSYVLEHIKNNIVWIKDIFTLIFSATATIIAIFTYYRAKETFLQPVRTEVIKKQTELLTNLLELLYKNKPDDGVDYIGITTINLYTYLLLYGFILKDKERIDDLLKTTLGSSSIFFTDVTPMRDDLEIIEPFEKTKQDKMPSDYSKKLYDQAKNGFISVDKIDLTKAHEQYLEKLRYYQDNPFLPKQIKIILDNLLKDIALNLKDHIRAVLGETIKTIFETKYTGSISPSGVFNKFNRVKIYHNNHYDELKTEVRRYLRIDNMLK